MWNPILEGFALFYFLIIMLGEIMGWRIICIEEAYRINYKLNSIGVLQKDEVIWINLDEIDIIIIESLYCNTTIKLLTEISKKGINVLFCGENHMPIGVLTSINDNQRTAKYNRIQFGWKKEVKQRVWTKIIKHKILLQIVCLYKLNKMDKIEMLKNYMNEVESGDITNREGLAAKVYFHELFGLDFVRTRKAEDIINSSLNYIYQVIRAKLAQEIIAHGYIPTLGIYHCSEYNYFGLADDFIEVYRPIVDFYVVQLINEENVTYLTPFFKEKLLNLLYSNIQFGNSKHKIIESIRLFIVNITDSISNEKVDEIIFPYFYDEN